MASINDRDLLRHLRQNNPDMLRNRPAIGLDIRMLPGESPDKKSSYHARSVLITPVADPIVAATARVNGATPRGSLTFQYGMGENSAWCDPAPVLAMLEQGICMPEKWAFTTKGPKDLTEQWYSQWNWAPRFYGVGHPVRTAISQAAEYHGRATNPYAYPGDGLSFAVTAGVVTYGFGHSSLWLKFFTSDLYIPDELAEEIGRVDLNLRPAGKSRKDPKPVYPAQAVAIAEWAADNGFALVDSDGTQVLARLRHKLAHSVVAWPRPGRPAQAVVSIGTRVTVPRSLGRVPAGRSSTAASRITHKDASWLAKVASADVPSVLPEHLVDLSRMASASAVDDDRLRPFQREAVGRHMATRVGYANVCSPGAGKSVMALDGMRRHSVGIPGYRGLVVAEANVRRQFSREASTWFPEARVVVVTGSKDTEALRAALSDAGDDPLLVFTSYALASSAAEGIAEEKSLQDIIREILGEPEPIDMLEQGPDPAADHDAPVADTDIEPVEKATAQTQDGSPDWSGQGDLLDFLSSEAASSADGEPEQVEMTLGQLLLTTHWHDLIADEAACLRNVGSKQSKALWALRENSDVAVALTGTPISRGLQDLARIVSWVRGDRHMFAGVDLDEEFDLTTAEGLEDFSSAFGPVLVRYDKSEFADELPQMREPLVLELEPSIAELRLANAARDELKRVYEELLTWMMQVEAANPGDEAYVQAREHLQAARGAWLGGTTLARMASSDPAALLGSSSAGVALLASQGLVQAATATPGTKRTAVVRMCVERVAQGERILVFTEFASCARGLIDDLRDAGIRVGEILGGGGAKRDEHVDAFRRGELDVMVSTSSGERGLNLQTATTLIHYDLPWTPEGVIQRTGRIERIGATATHIQVVFPIMKGTIEERIASLVVARAGAASLALDAHRGVDMAATESGRALGGLVSVADAAQLSGRDAALLEATRSLVTG